MLIKLCAAVDIELMRIVRCFVDGLILSAVLFSAFSATVRTAKSFFLRQKVIWRGLKLPVPWANDADFRFFVLIMHHGVVVQVAILFFCFL